MEFGDDLKLFIGLMVLAVVVITGILPTTQDAVDNSGDIGTVSNEVVNGTSGSALALSQGIVTGVNSFQKSTAANTFNSTLVTGNGSVNSSVSKAFTLTAPLDTGSVSAVAWTVRVTTQLGAGATANASIGGVNAGALSTGTTNFTVAAANRSSPLTVTLNFVGANYSNVTNVSVDYFNFQTNSGYAVTNEQVVPTSSGTFRLSYDYGTSLSLTTLALFALLPILMAVLLLYIFAQQIRS